MELNLICMFTITCGDCVCTCMSRSTEGLLFVFQLFIKESGSSVSKVVEIKVVDGSI